jgi:serine protease Do
LPQFCSYATIKLTMKRLNIIYLLTCFIIILSLCLGTSCFNVETSPSSDTTATTEPDWTLPLTENENPVLPDFVSVVAKVKPSVVAINTEVITYDIFNRPSIQEGAGSGWIIDEDGYVVTNNHVIEGAESITVTLADGRTFSAGIVGTDALTDLAVLKINAQDLVKADLGDSSKVRVGEWVLALGNPLGLGISAKEGIVSRVEVSVQISSGQTLYDLIETSAAINPGNSGGPLVNMRGEVIGITSVKIAMVGVEGMGYAMSSKTAIPVIEELVQKGYVVRPWLGITVYDVDQWLVFRYDLAVDDGAFVTQVTDGSPAATAGIKPGDVIVSLGGVTITNAQQLTEAIHSQQIGAETEITFWRGATQNTTYATLIESPPPS